MEQPDAAGRYVVISADCHGGGDLQDYRPYLPSAYLPTFDEWAATFDNPYPDLQGPNGGRNWDSERRLKELEADGVVGEVIYPNTIPPFFPAASLVHQPPAANAGDLELRWVGLRAHNRWLADFCDETPGRRAGIAQILLHDVDAAVAEIRWAEEAGLTGGVLLPGAPPGSGLPPLYAQDYEPIWAVCEELGMPVNNHSGSAAPDYGDYPEAKVMFLLEVTWWAHRTLWHLIFAGVLERHPDL
ncbi:MAG TPA: amidohydrolase family protein, partial [Acidimicrobiales bacterium]|nr:amidohydrolase family protein [Acidimicrobiales bacterium]